MSNEKLVASYLEKANIRLKALEFLHREKGYSDVVRQAQECVELLLKALLRNFGVEAPKRHDVSPVINSLKEHFPKIIQDNLKEITIISRTLRKEREMAFYGTDDWIPTEEYSVEDSQEAIGKAKKIFQWVNAAVHVKS